MTSIEKIAERLLEYGLVQTDELTRFIEVVLFAAPSLEHGPTLIMATWIKNQMSMTAGGHPAGLLGGIQELVEIEKGLTPRFSPHKIMRPDGATRRIGSHELITCVIALQWLVDSWDEAVTDESVEEGLTNVGVDMMPDVGEIEDLIRKLLGDG